jgi:hypothetical protein
MNPIRSLVVIAGLALAAAVPSIAHAQGGLFITGHDSDSHANGAYQRAGLDYLFFGSTANIAQAATRSALSIGYLGTSNGTSNGAAASGYTNRTFININTSLATAFTAGYDALIIGTGLDYISSVGSGLLNSSAASFAAYFNAGGRLYVNSEQGIGQSFYNFLPPFGVSVGSSINNAGVFTATAAGLQIGLTEAIVDADITHTTFSGVDTNLFTIFETFNVDGSAVALGLRNASIIGGGGPGGGFVGGITPVPEPSTYGLIGALALVGAVWVRRRKAAV